MSITSPSQSTLADDEISLRDFIQFFKINLRKIVIFILMGGILGGLYGKLASPIYTGTMIIAPALISKQYVIDPKITFTKVKMNTFYSKETVLSCTPKYYKGKNIEANILDFVKISSTKDEHYIKFIVSNRDKKNISDCLNLIENDFKLHHDSILQVFIEMKKTELALFKNKLKISQNILKDLDDISSEILKKTKTQNPQNLLLTNASFNKSLEIYELISQINRMEMDLTQEQTNHGGKALPIFIEQEKFPSPKLGLLLGLFLGGILGCFISLVWNKNQLNLNL
jgi:hypothetical protein